MKSLRRLIAIGALLLAVSWVSPSASAQDVQVPLSPDSTVYTVDVELRQELGLFPGLKGFVRAQLFQLPDTTYELVIEYRPEDRLLRQRRTLTQEDVDRLRLRVAQRMATTGALVDREQPGRPELLTWTTILSVAEGGLIIGAISPSSESLVAGFPLLAGAAGFFVPFFATQNRPVTEATGTLTGFGGLQGYAHGAQVAALLGDDDVDGQVTAGLMAVTGAVEAALGYQAGATRGWSPGMAEMIAYNGIAGNLLGFGAGITASGDESAARSIAGASLAGSVIGGVVGYRMGRTDTYTRGDARLYSQTGLLAAQLAISGSLVGNVESERGIGGALTGAGLVGLGVGATLVRGRDFSTYASNLITLGNYAGSLLGAGLATVANGSSDAITITQALGAVAGFGITYSVFAPDARPTATTNASASLRLRVTPLLTVAPESRAAEQDRRLQPGLSVHACF